jgi:hypothetical protein
MGCRAPFFFGRRVRRRARAGDGARPLPHPLPPHAQNAVEELERLERALADVRAQLLRRLHGALRTETFAATPPPSALAPPASPPAPASSNGPAPTAAGR